MKLEKTFTTDQEYEESLATLSKIFEADPDSAELMEAELLVTLIVMALLVGITNC